MTKKQIAAKKKEQETVSLILAIRAISKSLGPTITEMSKDELPQNVLDALKGLVQDEDMLSVLRAVHSRYIITEARADVWDAHIKSMIKKEIIT